MKPRVKQIDQQYDDGVLKVYGTKDVSAPGEYENIQTVVKHAAVRYQNRTVGYNRFVMGRQVNLEIERLLRIPKIPDIHTYDIIETEDGEQFQIEQVQDPQGVYPASLDLSLSAVKQRVEVTADDPD